MHIEFSLTDLNLWPSFLLDYVLHPTITVILCLLGVFVVLGNIIVVTAIWHENQLHSVTNYLIASLAAADCLVGLVVMPFSIISEIIMGSWTFGPTWCDLWHSFDVLASTASIMNLCAISLDRYLAITNPISYPTKMTPKRVALLIVSLWTCSSLISFPAILWWRSVGQGPLQQIFPSNAMITNESPNLPEHREDDIHQSISPHSSPASTQNHSTITNSMISDLHIQLGPLSSPSKATSSLQHRNGSTEIESVKYRCVFTDDTYYLLFSSFVSFYGPLCVMLYAYYRIYKAAVQQTRFLKYGSKQVMVGNGGKKSKRQRYISEHPDQATNEKCGLSEINCDVTSNMESYDRQHLVLRAHRGGGGGGINTTTSVTSNSKFSNNDNYSKCEQQRKRGGNTLGSGAAKSSIDDENNLTTTSSGHNSPTNDPKDNCLNQQYNEHSSRRMARINSTLDKKDKVRMDTQRFDLSPSGGEMAKNSAIEVAKDSTTSNLRISNQSSNSNAKRCDLESSTARERTESSPHLATKRAKTLIATIDSGSSTVDAYVVDSDHLSSHLGTEDSKMIVTHLASDGDAQTTISTSLKASEKTSHSTQRNIYRDYELPDEFCNSDSSRSSNSSVSYGTGSVSSILVRPQCSFPGEMRSNGEQGTQEDCMVRAQGKPRPLYQFRMRRALSVDGVEQRWFAHLKHKSNNTVITDGSNQGDVGRAKNMTVMKTGDDLNKKSMILMTKERHRASCGNPPIGESGSIPSPKSVRTLDIRSWVKMARARRGKKATSNNQCAIASGELANLVRPPASLMPLMMMNSDTSTDSSIVAMETRKIETIQEAGDELSDRPNDVDLACRVNVSDSVRRHARNYHRKTQARGGFKKTVSLESGCQNDRSNDVESGLNSSMAIANVNCRAKGQLLYYDSDKLIQSIVDLTAIHYIDCANQSAHQSYASGSKTNASDASTDEGARGHGSEALNQQGKLVKSSQTPTSVPRQQRSVGKKLTKLAKERKAAKTLGIVVGVFILCWLPFFVVNIIVAICGINCIYKPQVLLSIVTWLGWLNSAMNPVIYACWSRDFRRAFRRVLCTWVEFLCLYDGSKLAKKLRLKKGSNYSSAQEAHLNRTASNTKGAQTSVTMRSNFSEANRSLLSDQK